MRPNIRTGAKDIAECAVFTVLMAVASYIQIPFVPVPLTFQTAVSVLAGILLGWKKGMVSMSVYCFMGLVGLPVFSGGGGISYVLKPTFGYIIGFIAAAFVGGLIANRTYLPFWRYIVAALAACLADYALGIPYCMVAAKIAGGYDFTDLLIKWNLLYIPKDIVLCVLAAFIAKTVLPAIRKDKGKITVKR